MKNYFTLGLLLAVAIAVASHDAFARGGRGGGRPGGGRANFGGGQRGSSSIGQHKDNPTSQFKTGNQDFKSHTNKAQSVNKAQDFNKAQNFSNRNGNVQSSLQSRASQLQSNFNSANKPFTAGWYANHPGAFRFTHPHADAWAVASLGGAAAWLGLAAAGDSGYYATDDTSEDETTDETLTGEVEPESTNETSTESTSDPAAAAELAQTGAAAQTLDSSNYLPLGVFALAPQNQKEATALVQVAISKDGIVRGSFFDLLSDQEQPITGSVDKKTQKVAFTVGQNGKTVFETQLADLTRPSGEISLHYADGTASDWTVARQENPAASPTTSETAK